ncbi:MAG: MotA/TolQ/ExbB proton channel family protein [Pseudomonadota bacterium]
MQNSTNIPFLTLLNWLLLASLVFFALIIVNDLGVLPVVIASDVTRICALVLLIFILTSVHCGYRSWFIAHQFMALSTLQSGLKITSGHINKRLEDYPESLAKQYLVATRNLDSESDATQQGELLVEGIRGSHKVGWFIVGVLIKLGLLGTVIGFVMMLGTVSDLDTLDISGVKQLMQQMTKGMGIAMNTTMVGLISSILLGLQYLLLDRSADKFVVATIELGQNAREIQNTPLPQKLERIS